MVILAGKGPIGEFGVLLDETWRLKRGIASGISNGTIDEIYERARRHGALGGKLLGAGGTGFMLFFVPPERQKDVRTALADLMHVPFKFENDGSVIVHGYGNTPDPISIPPRMAAPELILTK
jgi:D-glycero-alpha-D-manno-heptose-7-phosphate kinase